MQSHREQEADSESPAAVSRSTHERLLSTQRHVINAFAKQAAMYIFAGILTWIFLIVSFFKDNSYIGTLKLCTQPMQGFFNLIIFMYHKVHSLRRRDRHLSIYSAILMTIFMHQSTNPRTPAGAHVLDDDDSSSLDEKTYRVPPLANFIEDEDRHLVRNTKIWRLGGHLHRNQDESCEGNAIVRSSVLTTGIGSHGKESISMLSL